MRTARWISGLVGAGVLLQRFAVPGTEIALLLPVLLAWVAAALLRGIVVLDQRRLVLFGAAVAATGATMLVQPLVVTDRYVSVGSWALVVVTSLAFVVRLVDLRSETYRLVLHRVAGWGVFLGALCVLMIAVQVAGLSYRDMLAAAIPSSLLLPGFATTYPIGTSSIFRANAQIGLEPSIVSFQLGIALVAAVLVRRWLREVTLIAAGLVATTSGSGMLLAAVAFVVLAAARRRGVLQRYVVPGAIALLVLVVTSYGQALLARVGEIGTTDSSASLRAVQPYTTLWPEWSDRLGAVLLGGGPGWSQEVVTASGVPGLLVPTPAKIVFDYGVLAGAVLAVFLLSCYRASVCRSLAIAVGVSLWTLQPGLTTTVLVLSAVALVTVWGPQPDGAPRFDDLADQPDPARRSPSSRQYSSGMATAGATARPQAAP